MPASVLFSFSMRISKIWFPMAFDHRNLALVFELTLSLLVSTHEAEKKF